MKKFAIRLGVLIVAGIIAYSQGLFNNVADVVEDTVDVAADDAEDVAVEDTDAVEDTAEEVIEEVEEVIEEDDMDNTTTVDLEASSVLWEGRANGKSHDGDIQLLEASLEMEDGELVGGSFVIDMTTIRSIEDDGSTLDGLNDHLQRDDFFDVPTYPTASLVITEVLEETIVADLTIKGVTLPVTLNRSEGDDGLGATFSIDSTQWGVQEGGSLVDQAKNALVSDDIDFVVTLVLQ